MGRITFTPLKKSLFEKITEHKRLEEGTKIKGFTVDSLRDIATNKLLTINQRTQVKDFVDLFFC